MEKRVNSTRKSTTRHLSWDELRRPAPDSTDFDRVVKTAMSRRGFMRGVLAFGSAAGALNLMATTSAQAQAASRFAFTPIDMQTDFSIHVPEGYDWGVLVSWGDPLFSDAAQWDPANGSDAATSDRVFGENTDGMELFEIDGKQIIAVNHEYVNEDINLPAAARESASIVDSAEDAMKLINLQGVTIMKVSEATDGWSVVVDSPYNCRFPGRIDPAFRNVVIRSQ